MMPHGKPVTILNAARLAVAQRLARLETRAKILVELSRFKFTDADLDSVRRTAERVRADVAELIEALTHRSA